MASPSVIIDFVPNEDNWVDQINEMLHEVERKDVDHLPSVCVHHVPKSLTSSKPEAFTPQLLALGPYHHFRPELYPMERFKLTAVARFLEFFFRTTTDHHLQLQVLVDQLLRYGPQIRACYHKYIDHKNSDTLFYVMAIDSMFLLDLLYCYREKNGGCPSYLESHTGVKLTTDAVIRDVFMLENQIPTYALRKMLSLSSSEQEDVVNLYLGELLKHFCESFCPLPLEHVFEDVAEVAAKHDHILDILYHMIVPPEPKSKYPAPPLPEIQHDHDDGCVITSCRGVWDTIKPCFDLLVEAYGGVRHFLERLSTADVPSRLQPIKKLCGGVLKVLPNPNSEVSGSPDSDTRPPMIPSVTELQDVGVRFKPTKGGIGDIHFEGNTLYLPQITLDVNTEVIMRNLVAYEVLTRSNFLIFTKYTELMRAIVDTVEDVKVLVDEKILVNKLGKDDLAEQLFNGMSKSIGPTNTKDLNDTIKEVKKHYDNVGKVRAYRLMKKNVYSSWRIFTLLATLALLALMVLQTFCSFYDCPRNFDTGTKQTA